MVNVALSSVPRGTSPRPKSILLLLVGMFLLLTGCSDFVDHDQVVSQEERAIFLTAGETVGQTFVAQHGGLHQVDIYLIPSPSASGELSFRLREDPLSTHDILSTTMTVDTGTKEGFFLFSFPPLQESHSHYYYGIWEFRGNGYIEVPVGAARSYQEGSLYYNSDPLRLQSIFRLHYIPSLILLSLWHMARNWSMYGLLIMVLLFFSGYPIIHRQVKERDWDFTKAFILSSATALAAWMILLVWLDVMHLSLSSTYVRLLAITTTVIGAIIFALDKELWRSKRFWAGDSGRQTLILWAVVLGGIILRLFIGHNMIMTPGSDTYHHTLITELFYEQGGIPHSYAPYAHLITFSYHFGFHSIAALFRWLFDSELLVTTKTTALVLNGAVAATLGLLSEEITRSRRAAIITAMSLAFIIVSPFCLLLWGRFTQTTGLFFLPLAMLSLTGEQRTRSSLSSFLVAATLLSHYRLGMFLLLFVTLNITFVLSRNDFSRILSWIYPVSLSLLAITPWLVHVAWIQLDPYHLRLTYPVFSHYYNLTRLSQALAFPTNVPILLVIVVLAILIPRHPIKSGQSEHMKTLLLWMILLLTGSFISSCVGFTFWDPKTTILTLIAFTAILLGRLSNAIWESCNRQRVIQGILAAGMLWGSLTGIRHFPALLNQGNFYLKQADMVMMKWIENNTSPEDSFAVDAFQFDWSPGWVVGINAGYWIPLLTHRTTALPPMIYPVEWGKLPQLLYDVRCEQICFHANAIPKECKVDFMMTQRNIVSVDEVFRYENGVIINVHLGCNIKIQK